MGKIWDFLQDTIPPFTHPGRSFQGSKSGPAQPNTGSDPIHNDDKNLKPKPENGKSMLQSEPHALCTHSQKDTYACMYSCKHTSQLHTPLVHLIE